MTNKTPKNTHSAKSTARTPKDGTATSGPASRPLTPKTAKPATPKVAATKGGRSKPTTSKTAVPAATKPATPRTVTPRAVAPKTGSQKTGSQKTGSQKDDALTNETVSPSTSVTPMSDAVKSGPKSDRAGRGGRRDHDVDTEIDDTLLLSPGFDLATGTDSSRVRRPLLSDSEDEVVATASFFDLWLEKPAGEDPDDLDAAETVDDEADADLLEALSNPTPMPGRWNPEVQLTSADYNDRNQDLFARRNEVLERVAKLEAKRRRSREDEETLRRARFELDTVTNDIVSFNYGLVLNYTRKFTSTTSKDDSADFEAAGVVGLMRAVKSYDPTRGTKFSTWAYKPIQREILKAVRDADFKQLNPGDFEKRPEILRAVKALQNGDEEFVPTFEAVAAEAGATLDAVKRILNAPVIDSLSAPMGEDGDTSLTDMIEDPSAGVEDMALARQEIMDLERFGLSCLDERELFVIGRRFGLDGEPPQRLSAIGTLLGLSREAVRQVEAKALSKLLHPVTRRRLVRHGRR